MVRLGKRPLHVLSGLLVVSALLAGAMLVSGPAEAIPTDPVIVCNSWSNFGCCPTYHTLQYQRRQCWLCSQSQPFCSNNWYEYRCLDQVCQ